MIRILFVDDNQDVLDIYQDEVSHRFPDIETLFANDGIEAIDVFDKKQPPLVFTDGKMPRKNGVELATELKNKPQAPRVYMVTGHFEETSKEKLDQAGIRGIFSKPIDYDEFLSFIEKEIEELKIS